MDWRDAGGPWGRGIALLVVLAALWLLAGPRSGADPPVTLGGPGLETKATSPAGGAAKPAAVKRYVVHVAGAVRRPGVYRVRGPGRLIDAVERAGGLTSDADLTQVNLAARLTDGRQIIVPRLAGGPAAGAAGAGGAASGAGGGGSGTAPAAKVSLNSASSEQLQTLDGVGPAMAAAIIELRTTLGGFTELQQLDDVPGIGEKRLASLKSQVEL